MKTMQQFQAKIAEEQGRVQRLQAQLFAVSVRQDLLNREKETAERELAGALARVNAWAEARQMAAEAEKQAAARAQGGPRPEGDDAPPPPPMPENKDGN